MNGMACHKVEDMPSLREITKSQRTLLGENMRDVIVADTEYFNIVPKTVDRYQATYQFLQQLYDQAYFFLRHDAFASQIDKWDKNRTWEVFIIESNHKDAFCLPGGDFFITTEFLKTIQQEYELFYVMTFEAVLMNERHLLKRLIPSAYSTIGLVEIIEKGVNHAGITLEKLTADVLKNNTYNIGTVREIDEITNIMICQSSLFNRLAIIPILNRLKNNDVWLQNRPSYHNRTDYIINEIELTSADCGTRKWAVQQSDYQDFISPLP